MISDDEYLERIVAGIHAVTTTGADVAWNEVINGRQFDVVVRFKVGSLRYLVLVEVKNRTRKAAASDMDAFVLKARDQNANKTVFVTAAGFQEGAITVAKRHGVDLFTVTFDETEVRLPQNATLISIRNPNAPKDAVPEFSIGEPEFVQAIEKVTLVYSNGPRRDMPIEQSQMAYYFGKTKLSDGRTFNDLIQTIPLPEVQFDETAIEEVRLAPAISISPPDAYFFPAGELKGLVIKVSGRKARPMRGNIKLDPNLFTSPVVYTNAITGEEARFALEALPLGVKRVSPGAFYFTVHPLAYFYCEAFRGDEMLLNLVESFQAGELLQVTLRQNVKYSYFYIPVTDKKIINRLQARLDTLRTRG